MVDAFKTCGSSPPRRDTVRASAPPQNCTVRTVSFRLVREPFGILMLNAQSGQVAYHEVSVGTLNASLVHPREVFGPVLRVMGVASIILVHNHPSCDPTPSREDLRLTRQLMEAGRLLDITVHDHVIVGSGTEEYVSLAACGELEAR